jgi:hypothetical protein
MLPKIPPSGSARAKSTPAQRQPWLKNQHHPLNQSRRSSSEAPSTASESTQRSGRQDRRSAGRRSGEQDRKATKEEDEVMDQPPSSAHAEITRLTKLLPALKSPEDDSHMETIKSRITALKREATAAKPLEEQITILQNLVKRKTHTLDNLALFISDAQKEQQTAGAELNQINADLLILKQRRLAELDIQPVQVANPQAQAHILQQEQVIAQMAFQLNQLQTMLLAVQAAQVPHPSSASADGIQAAPPTPFAPGAAPGSPPAHQLFGSAVAPTGAPQVQQQQQQLQQQFGIPQAATAPARDAPATETLPPVPHSVALVDVYSSEPLSQASPVIIVDTEQEIARSFAIREAEKEAQSFAIREAARKSNRERSPRGVANRDGSPDLTRQQITDPLFR